MLRSLPLLASTLAVAMLAGCAGREFTEAAPLNAYGGSRQALPIQVSHDAAGPVSLAIYLVDGRGHSTMLGYVSVGRTETFLVEQPIGPAPHRLVAGEGPGRTSSRAFNLSTRGGVWWRLGINILQGVVRESPD